MDRGGVLRLLIDLYSVWSQQKRVLLLLVLFRRGNPLQPLFD